MPERPTEPTPQRPHIKDGFSRYNVSPGEPRTLPPVGFIRVYSMTGTLTLSFNDGDAVPCMAGDKFYASLTGKFEKVQAESSGGAVLILGFGTNESPGARTRYDETTGAFYVTASTGEIALIV